MRLVNVNHIFAARNVQEVHLDQGIQAVVENFRPRYGLNLDRHDDRVVIIFSVNSLGD